MTVVDGKKLDITGFHSVLMKEEPSIDLFKEIAVQQLNRGISNGERNLILIKKTLITFQIYKENYFKKRKKIELNVTSNIKIENTLIECNFDEDIEIGHLKKKICVNTSGKAITPSYTSSSGIETEKDLVIETPSSLSNNSSKIISSNDDLNRRAKRFADSLVGKYGNYNKPFKLTNVNIEELKCDYATLNELIDSYNQKCDYDTIDGVVLKNWKRHFDKYIPDETLLPNEDSIENEVDDDSDTSSQNSDTVKNYVDMPTGKFVFTLKNYYGTLGSELKNNVQNAHFKAILNIFKDPQRKKDHGPMLEWGKRLYNALKNQFGNSSIIISAQEYFGPVKGYF
jgi:hypothetical protein